MSGDREGMAREVGGQPREGSIMQTKRVKDLQEERVVRSVKRGREVKEYEHRAVALGFGSEEVIADFHEDSFSDVERTEAALKWVK